MHTFEHTIEIEAPIDHVFAWGTDPANWTRSTPSLSEIEVIEDTDEGTRMRMTYHMLGRPIESELVFRIVEPNAHTVSMIEGSSLNGELHYRYEETKAGTEVTLSSEYELGDSLFDRVMTPVATRFNDRQFRNSLKTMKELIEAEVTAKTIA